MCFIGIYRLCQGQAPAPTTPGTQSCGTTGCHTLTRGTHLQGVPPLADKHCNSGHSNLIRALWESPIGRCLGHMSANLTGISPAGEFPWCTISKNKKCPPIYGIKNRDYLSSQQYFWALGVIRGRDICLLTIYATIIFLWQQKGNMCLHPMTHMGHYNSHFWPYLRGFRQNISTLSKMCMKKTV